MLVSIFRNARCLERRVRDCLAVHGSLASQNQRGTESRALLMASPKIIVPTVIDAVIIMLAGTLTTLAGFRLVGDRPGINLGLDAWHRRFGRFMKLGGPALIAIGSTLFLVSRQHSASEAPSIHLEGNVLVSKPLGLRLQLPVSWHIGPPQPGADFVATDEATGGVLIGTVVATDPPGQPVSTMLGLIVDGRRGSAKDIERGQTHLGELGAEFASMTLAPRNVRLKTVMAQKGPYTVSFTCNDGTLDLQICSGLLAGVVLPK